MTRHGRILMLVLTIVILAHTGGCWDRLEVDQLAIALATAVDRVKVDGEPRVRFAVLVVKPPGGGGQTREAGAGGAPGGWVSAHTGRTVAEAERNFSTQSPRKLFLAHADILVIGEDMAREGISEVLDFYERKPELRLRTRIMVAQGEALEILQARPNLENTAAQEIRGMIQRRVHTSKGVDMQLHEFLRLLATDGADPFAARIILKRTKTEEPQQAQDGARAGGEAGGGGSSSQQRGPAEVRLSGAAVFREDRLAGWLNPAETRGLLWIRGDTPSSVMVVNAPGGGNERISVEIKGSVASRRVRFSADDRISLTVDIRIEGAVVEVPPDLDLTQPAVITHLERRLATVIAGEVQAAVRRAQELKTDIFGFGESVRRAGPRQWRQLKQQWREVFPTMEVDVRVKARIRRTGHILKPLSP